MEAIALLTPAQVAAAFGTGQLGPEVSTATALGSLGPNERRYVHDIASLPPTRVV